MPATKTQWFKLFPYLEVIMASYFMTYFILSLITDFTMSGML